MHVQVTGDGHVKATGALADEVRGAVDEALSKYAARVTRVEVHLGDENSHKTGTRDKRCVMEARLGGLPPIAVTHHAASLPEAIEGAAEKLERAVGSHIGRVNDR